VLRLYPINSEATVVANVYFPGHDRKGKTVAMGNPDELFFLSKALDIVNRYSTAHVTLIVRTPILHEITNILDVDAGARNLPKSGMGGLAASTRLSLVTGLLQELASKTSSQLSDLTCLFPLFR
jgi:hypothetical protein